MKLELPDEYYQLRESVERLLAARAGAQALRACWEGEIGGSGALWTELAQIGLASLTLPEGRGGAGVPLLAALPVIESFGLYAVAQPVAETIGVVSPALVDEPERSDVTAWLEEIDSGQTMAAVQHGWDGHATWGADVGLVLVVDGDDVLVCRPLEGSVTPIDGLDASRRPARVAADAAVGRLKSPGAAAEVRRRALIVAATLLNGLSDAVIRRSVEYATQRHQFGRPIGSFQAVKHLIADAFVHWEFTRRQVWYAEWLSQHRPDAAYAAAAQAKAVAGDVAAKVNHVGLQVHAGVGFTWESDLQLWLKRMQVLDGELGNSDVHWAWLARQADRTDDAPAWT